LTQLGFSLYQHLQFSIYFSYILGQVTDAESLFTYEPDECAANFSVPDHVPPFLDEIVSNLTTNSTLVDVCGDNIECLFDFGQTGDPDVGMAAMMVENQTASEMQDACKIMLC